MKIVLLIMLIEVSQNFKNISQFTVYRIPTPSKMGDKVILVNLFGQPGIQVLHAGSAYTDVKVPSKLNNTFLQLFSSTRNIQVIDNDFYFGTNPFKVTQTGNRRSSFVVEQEYEVFTDFDEDDNYFTAPFRGFLDYRSITDYLKYFVKKASTNVHLLNMGTTMKNHSMYAVIIKSGINNSSTVFIEGGTIAREWMSITMALYLIKEIGTNISAHPTIRNLDWIIVPVVNPDGYEYSYRNPKFRFWEKNRNCHKKCKRGSCGVNIDRNFPHYHKGIGASLAPCSSLYLGPSALSERESQNLQAMMMANRRTLKLYVGLRSFGAYILYPWGLKAEEIFDAPELIRVAKAAANAMYNVHKGKYENYTISNYAKVKYPAAGNIMDFARGVINIKYSYVIYIRGDGGGEKGYTPESSQIVHIISECFEGIKSLAEYVSSTYPPPKGNLREKKNKRKRSSSSPYSKTFNTALMLLVCIICHVK